MFLFWFFGMTVLNKGASHFHTLDLTHCVYVILHSSSSPPTCNSLVASFGVSVPSCLDYCNSFLAVSLSLSLPHHYPSPKAIWLWNLLTLKTCSLFPHELVAILLRKTQKALHSQNPTFLFCFYQSTHITYLLVTLELFYWPLALLDLSGLFVFFAFAQAIPSAWDAFLAFSVCKTPLFLWDPDHSTVHSWNLPCHPSLLFHRICIFLPPKSHHLLFHFNSFLLVSLLLWISCPDFHKGRELV